MVDVGRRDVFCTIPTYVEWKRWVLRTRAAGENRERARTYLPVFLLTLHHDTISFTSICGNKFPGICSAYNPGQCSGSPAPPSHSPPSRPTRGMTAMISRYWDCLGGACGCSYIPTGLRDDQPAQCHINTKFAAPRGNPYGAKFYGAAAVSKHLGGMGWLGPSCGKCWKVTGMSISGASSTLVLKGTNVCPDNNPLCAAGPHFDIAAPGFGKYWKI